jgi:cytochrome P450
MLDLVLEVMFSTLFGLEGERARALRDPFVALLEVTDPALRFLADRPSVRATARVEAAIGDEIARHRRGDVLADFAIAHLVDARRPDGSPLPDASLVDHAKTLLLAAHDTTATTLAWMVRELLDRPELTRAWAGELARSDEHVEAVVREVLRLHPAVPVLARTLAEDVRIGARTFSAGTLLAPNLFLMHRDPALFRDADAFAPERFLGPSRASSTAILAFGAGSRRCLGAAFATTLLRVALRRLFVDSAFVLSGARRTWRRSQRTVAAVRSRLHFDFDDVPVIRADTPKARAGMR